MVATVGYQPTTLMTVGPITHTPRFLQAGGRQEILPGCFGLVNKRFKTPMFSLLFVVTYEVVLPLTANLYRRSEMCMEFNINNRRDAYFCYFSTL